MTLNRNDETITLLCVHCGCRVVMVGLGWHHLDYSIACLPVGVGRKGERMPTATPTLWVETTTGEPF